MFSPAGGSPAFFMHVDAAAWLLRFLGFRMDHPNTSPPYADRLNLARKNRQKPDQP
jgi:hypothetical protein